MLFAVWHPRDQLLAPSLQSRVSALVESGEARFDGRNGAIAVWGSARLVPSERGACAHGDCDRSGAALPGRPIVRLEEDALVVSAGTLPQVPLYFVIAEDERYVVVCSRLAPLATIFRDAPIRARRLVSLIAYGLETDTSETVFAGVRRLRACETITAEGARVRVDRVFPHIADRYRRGTAADLGREFLVRLSGAVQRAMGASKHVAVFVSGGLDSSGILALALADSRGPANRKLDAISLQLTGPGDDRPHFAELARALGVAPVRLFAADAAPWFRQSLCMDAQPGSLPSTCLFLFAGTVAAKSEADVVLTGVSGDKVSGGVFPFAGLTQWARRGHVLGALSHALRLRLPWPMGRMLRMRYVLSPLVPERVRRWRRRFGRRPEAPRWMTSRAKALWVETRAADGGLHLPLPNSPDSQLECLCTRSYMSDTCDTVGQLASATGCLPVDAFLDEDFVRFVLEIEPVLLNCGHEYRGLYRLATKDLLPPSLRMRRDKGAFEPGIAAAAGNPGVAFLRELSSLEALAGHGLANPKPLRPAMEACFGALQRDGRGEFIGPVPGDEYIPDVWQLLSAEAFLREHGRAREIS
jgi:asparagine synthetase B (glutamine-hydrolysing)